MVRHLPRLRGESPEQLRERCERQPDAPRRAHGRAPHAFSSRLHRRRRRLRDFDENVARLQRFPDGDATRGEVDVHAHILRVRVRSLVRERGRERRLGVRPPSALHLRLSSKPIQRRQPSVHAHRVLAPRGSDHPPRASLRERLARVRDEMARDDNLTLHIARVFVQVEKHVIETLLHARVVRPTMSVRENRARRVGVRPLLFEDAHQILQRAPRRLAPGANLRLHQRPREREVLQRELRVLRARVRRAGAGARAR